MKKNFYRFLLLGIVIALALFFYWNYIPVATSTICNENLSFSAPVNAPSVIYFIHPQGKTSLYCYRKSKNHPLVDFGDRGIILGISNLEDYDFPPLAATHTKKDAEDALKKIEPYAKWQHEHPIEERVHLRVDGKLVSNWSRRIASSYMNIFLYESLDSGAHGATFSWVPRLLPGKHTAKVVIETLLKGNIEYEWDFEITN